MSSGRPRPVSRRTVLGLGGGAVAAAAFGGWAVHGRDEDVPVVRVQRRLNDHGFWCGRADGVVGDLTTCAVLAFQKAHGRPPTGVLDTATVRELSRKRGVTHFSRQGHVVEVDVDRQLLRVVEDGVVQMVLHATTGSGLKHSWGGRPVADSTPHGRFRLRKGRAGSVESSLGRQYRPHTFLLEYGIYGHDGLAAIRHPSTTGGIAVHPRALDRLVELRHLSPGRLVWVA